MDRKKPKNSVHHYDSKRHSRSRSRHHERHSYRKHNSRSRSSRSNYHHHYHNCNYKYHSPVLAFVLLIQNSGDRTIDIIRIQRSGLRDQNITPIQEADIGGRVKVIGSLQAAILILLRPRAAALQGNLTKLLTIDTELEEGLRIMRY